MRKVLCPNCREVELVPVRTEAAVVEECPKCRGIWFDAEGDELQRVLALGPDRVPSELLAGSDSEESKAPVPVTNGLDRPCPKCGAIMSRYWYAGEPGRTFLVDSCAHGVWLDGGELRKAWELLQTFERTRKDLERRGEVDAALSRSAGADEGPRSIFQDKMWEAISAFCKSKVDYW